MSRTASQSLRLLRCAAPRRGFAAAAVTWPQKCPLGPYYEIILHHPTRYRPEEASLPPSAPPERSSPPTTEEKKEKKKPEAQKSPPPTPTPTPPPPAPRKKKPGRKSPPAETSSSAPPPTPAERARVVFGSRLLGPAEEADRLASKGARSTYVAGVVVPPRPEEPDNCCMSGCVNCVWERYREDMEEWSAKSKEAQMRLAGSRRSVDDDGGRSETDWDARLGGAKIARNMWDEEVFANVPVGIREFMKHEKRLRESRQERAV
ncbi:hypothetical protein L249_2561 [Ophiocordyceps polyrhachis-furcata BCC 54312]|uniref:Oxidoreductase-like domain-containing protein n=1 Tax=Ophiocordyceps polyrhachis-furcata BCC 54312 TaxID=1330021 RepID=A0A367LN09_9HYPO|nr:hypothetical protein L249_2561 [Ophiocordyceps polyrhachis-furcata BCC 54312]